jgi:hypothetical protein
MYMYFVNKYINKRKENQIIIYVKYLTINCIHLCKNGIFCYHGDWMWYLVSDRYFMAMYHYDSDK